MRCWGDNSEGQLGVGNTASVEVPTQVGQDTGWTAISTGFNHTCGIRSAVAYCWGNNDFNQVGGSGPVVVSPRPVAFAFNDFVVENIFTLDGATCATGKRGGANQLYCWGSVETGPFVTLGSLQQPTLIADNPVTTKWTKVSGAREHRCALRDDGAVYCWGENRSGQAGGEVMPDGSNDTVLLASAQRIGDLTYLDIATGQNSSCAVTTNHRLHCWGSPNENIAPPATTNTHLPREVLPTGSAAPNFRTVSIGFYYACATDMAGGVSCFGNDTNGAMGYEVNLLEGFNQGTATPRPVRLVAEGVAPQVVTLVTGFDFACVRTATGAPVLCWGAQDRGQLGIGNFARSGTPATAALNLPATETVVSIAAGANHTCASIQRSDGVSNSCWGANFDSQVTGVVTDNSSAMIPLPPRTTFRSVTLAAGATNSCSIIFPGATNVACWGNNSDRQLGPNIGTRYTDVTPVSTSGNLWTLVATNGNSACAVERTTSLPAVETLRCWGVRLGQADTEPETIYSPTVTGQATPYFDQLTMGNGFGMAVVRTGAASSVRNVMTWGFGDEGQLSPIGGATRGNLQTVLPIPPGATSVSLAPAEGGGHACISWIDGGVATVQCWGRNNQLQLGSPTQTDRFHVLSFPAGFVTRKVVTGLDHSCALSIGGSILCWGSGYDLGLEANVGATPRSFGSNTIWSDLVTGNNHVCAVSENRQVVQCWGTSKFGQFGNGARYHPDPVPALVTR